MNLIRNVETKIRVPKDITHSQKEVLEELTLIYKGFAKEIYLENPEIPNSEIKYPKIRRVFIVVFEEHFLTVQLQPKNRNLVNSSNICVHPKVFKYLGREYKLVIKQTKFSTRLPYKK